MRDSGNLELLPYRLSQWVMNLAFTTRVEKWAAKGRPKRGKTPKWKARCGKSGKPSASLSPNHAKRRATRLSYIACNISRFILPH